MGDFTAMVGDPTGKSEARPRLTRPEVLEAAKTYTDQAFLVLDRERTVVRYNSEWIDELGAAGMVGLCANHTVARMLERNDFAQRFQQKKPIHVHEFLYPLLQGYDSVALECDVEVGGTDQLFNLLVGRDLMPRYGKRAQVVMTLPLLEGTDARMEDGQVVGPKMSKSAGNYIGISEAPAVMLHKIMLVDDQVIWRYLELLSAKPLAEMAQMKEDVRAGRMDMVRVKEGFAEEMLTTFHSSGAARAALEERRLVAGGGVPGNIPEFVLESGIGVAKALMRIFGLNSIGEGRRFIVGRAVQVNGEVLEDAQRTLTEGEYLFRLGSKTKRFARVKIVE